MRFFWKSASMVATAFPASGAVVSSASGAVVSSASGAVVSSASGAVVSSASNAKVSPTGNAKVSPTGGVKVWGAKVSPTGNTKVLGAKVSRTWGAKVWEAKASSTSNAKVSPTGGAKVSPTGGAKVSPTGGAKVSPTGGAKVSPSGGAKVSPSGNGKVSPTGGAKVSPTGGAKVSPSGNAKVSPTGGAKVSPTGGAKVSPTGGAKVSPSGGAKVSPSGNGKVSPTGGAKVSPTGGAKVSPTGGAKVSPSGGAKVSPTGGAKVSPSGGAKVSPSGNAKVSPSGNGKVSPTGGAKVPPTGGAKVPPTGGAKVPPTGGAKVPPTGGAKVSPTGNAKVSPSGGAKVSPTGGAKVSPTGGAKVSPTSQWSSGIGARRPNFDKNDMNAIHKAARDNNHWRVQQIFFFNISDVNERDKKRRTALHVACAYGHPRMVKRLIKRPCLLNLCDIEEKTALIYAIQYRNTECANVLLDYGPDLNIKDNDGNTALHYAVLDGNTAIVHRLLARKANIEARNKSDLTPLALAKLANNDEMVKFLVARGGKDDQMKSKQQLTSEEKGPQKSESCTPVMEPQKTRKEAWTKTKTMIVMDVSEKDSLSSQQKITSKTKEEKGPQKSESRTPVTDLRKTQEAWTKTKSMTEIVIDVSEEDSLSSKQPLTSTGKYKEERGPQKSEGCTAVVIDLQKTQKQAGTERKSRTVVDTSEEDSLSSKQQLTSKYKEERRPQRSESGTLDLQKTRKQALTERKSRTVVDTSEEDSSSSKPGIDDSRPTLHDEDLKVKEEKKQKSSKRKVSGNMYNAAATDSGGWNQKSKVKQTDKQQLPIMESEDSARRCSKPGIDDSRPTSHIEDLKDKVVSETHTPTAKTSKNQSKHIRLPLLHLGKMTRESQINRACDKEDTSADSGHPSMQKKEQMCIKQGTLKQRENLQLRKDQSKQKSHESSVKFKMTDYPEEEPLRNHSKEGASLRQMLSNLTSKMLDCEGKDAFGKSASAALQAFPGREKPTLKIVSPSHADPGSPIDSPWSSSSELCLREKELYPENDHKPDAEHVLNKNEESFHNDTENKKVRYPVVTSEVKEDQEFAMQMTKNMNPNTMDWKLGIGPTPQSRDPKSHLELQRPCCNEIKLIIDTKSQYIPAVTNTYKETKPNQDLFQKPLCADHCSANYCKSMDSKLKDEHSSALCNDRTPGVYVIEELQQDVQRLKNEVDMLKAEGLAWKKEKVQLQKEVEEEKKKLKGSKRKVSGNIYNAAADDDSDGRSQQSKVEQTDKQQLSIMESEDSDRSTLRGEKEKRRKADLLCEKNRVQLRKKEKDSIKVVEMNPQLETTIKTQAITLKIIGENEVSESSEKEKRRLHENRMMWDEIAKLKLKMGTIKKTQEMGKEYSEEIAIAREKNDHLRKTIREKEFQHSAQLEVLRAELIMLNSKLEDEQQNRGRLEAEVESYRSRLATVVQDHEHCQTSKRDLQLTLQRTRDEWFCLWDKMNSDMPNLTHNNEILSQQLSKAESKTNSLEVELHHTRDALNERAILERDLSQKQCQKEETEHMYQEEQGKVDKDNGKQESLQEKFSHLQSEIMLLQQQLGQAHNKVDRVINIQDQIPAIIKIFDGKNENYALMLKKIIEDLTNDWHHFKERIQRYKNDGVKKDAIARQFQQELANTKQKLSTIEVYREIESRHRMHLEDKKQDFKNKLDQSRSQNDDLKAKLQPSSSKCIRLDEEKTPQQELAMGALLKRREELKPKQEKWQQRPVKLRTRITEDCVGEKHKVTAKDLADQVTQLDLFLQGSEAASRGQH